MRRYHPVGDSSVDTCQQLDRRRVDTCQQTPGSRTLCSNAAMIYWSYPVQEMQQRSVGLDSPEGPRNGQTCQCNQLQGRGREDYIGISSGNRIGSELQYREPNITGRCGSPEQFICSMFRDSSLGPVFLRKTHDQ